MQANLRQNPKSKTFDIAERRFENLLRQFAKLFLGIPKFRIEENFKEKNQGIYLQVARITTMVTSGAMCAKMFASVSDGAYSDLVVMSSAVKIISVTFGLRSELFGA